MKKLIRTSVMGMGLIAVLGFFPACGGSGTSSSMVKDVQVVLSTVQGDLYANLLATVDTGATSLPSISMPIFDPKNFSIEYGHVSMAPALGGGTEFTVNVDLTKAAQVSPTVPLLPNGSLLPIGGISQLPVITLPLGLTSSVLYLTLTQKVAMIGAAVPIKELDQVGGTVGGINLFPSFQMPNGINGLAGIFTGSRPGQSGVALFFDFSSTLPSPPAAASLNYENVIPASQPLNEINKAVYKLNKRKAQLHLH